MRCEGGEGEESESKASEEFTKVWRQRGSEGPSEVPVQMRKMIEVPKEK